MAKKRKKYDIKRVKIEPIPPLKNERLDDVQSNNESIIEIEQPLEEVKVTESSMDLVEDEIMDNEATSNEVTYVDQEEAIEFFEDMAREQDDMEEASQPLIEYTVDEEEPIEVSLESNQEIEKPPLIEEEPIIEEIPIVQTKEAHKKAKKEAKRNDTSRFLAMIGLRNALIIYLIVGVAAFVFYPRSDRKAIDPFTYVNVEFTGISQRGKANIVIVESDEYSDVERELLGLLFKYYVVDPSQSLRSGQSVRLTLDTAKMGEVNEYLAAHKLRFNRAVKMIKVPKLPTYILNDDDLRKDGLPAFQAYCQVIGEELIRSQKGDLPPVGEYQVEVIDYLRYGREQFEGVVSNFAVVFKTSYKGLNDAGETVDHVKYHVRYLNNIMYDAEGKVVFDKVDNFTSGELVLDDILRTIPPNYIKFE